MNVCESLPEHLYSFTCSHSSKGENQTRNDMWKLQGKISLKSDIFDLEQMHKVNLPNHCCYQRISIESRRPVVNTISLIISLIFRGEASHLCNKLVQV